MVACETCLGNLSSNRTEMERVTCSVCCDFMALDTSHSCLSRTRLRVHRGRTRARSPGDGVLVRCCMVTVLILHCVTVSGALEARVSSTDPGGVVVFNASLGYGWSYHVDESKSKSSLPFLQLDSSTGLVYWRGGKDRCQHLMDNPVQLHIVSKTWHHKSPTGANSTTVPYSVFIHGCKQTNRTWKSDRLKNKHRIKVSASGVVSSQCIRPMTSLIKLTDFLPHTFQQCEITVDLPASSPIYVNESSLVFLSAVKMCLVYSGVSVEFNVSVLCDHSQEFQVPFTLSISPHFLGSYTPRRRSRRAANNKPVFERTEYNVHVKEGESPGVQVVIVTATDTDSEGAGTLTYSMFPASDDRSQNQFSINPLTGTINTTVRLDRESMKAHYFLVFATDRGIPPQSASASVTITVDDVNDHAPEFNQPVYSIDFAENQPIDSPVKTILATDRDSGKNSEIRYSILNPASPNNAFNINRVTGAIFTMKSLDRETLDFYQLLIQAVDQGELSERKSSTATVNITITDKNDNSPVFAKKSYIVDLKEDVTPNSAGEPIIQVTATDDDIDDNAKIEYVLSGNTEGKFRIDSTTGEIFLMDSLDYEEEENYQLTVRAEDQGRPPKRTIASVLVQVVDVNDNTPVFSAPSYSGNVLENSADDTSIIQVQAFDSDSGKNSELTYSVISNGEDPPLSVDPRTGWIRTSGDINREHKREYKLTVQVTDNGDPKRTATTTVTIDVHDINDNPPIFTSRIYRASVSEEARIGKEVVRVSAQDNDEGDNARVTYEITYGDSGHHFQMTQVNNEGLITVKRKLDARQQNQYSLTVTATDTGNLKDTVTVKINVTDTNRHAPQFLATPFQFAVDENVEIGKSVFRVSATDQDRGENADITYSLDPGIPAFSIDPKKGVISTRVELNREDTPGYTLRVTATDNGDPQKEDSEDIIVTVNDENDNKPEFTETSYTGRISEDAPLGASVLTITARDFDTDTNGIVYYTFRGGYDGNGDFNIDSANGDIRVAKALDRERVAKYELVALAVDRGTPPQSSSVSVEIQVLDVNDMRPEFESREIDVYVLENSPVGTTVATIKATDPDEGVNARVEYSFVGGADVDSFKLDGLMGDPAIITTCIPLDYELGKKRYEVRLRAKSDTLFSDATVYINVRDVNDHVPELKDFTIIYNNFGGSFPRGPIGRIPAFDPDVIDQELLTYRILSGNEAGLLQLNSSTGLITLDSRLNSDVPRNGTFRISVSDGKNEVKATCQLYVRLVTPEMLHDSVTIRLNKMTETAFLSSLLKFFTDALASIFNTEPTNIFIINIENDIDVAPSQILNVSVSVRKGFVSEQGRTKDVFNSPEYLREYIYLYRAQLANRSALQVLPFDDNLCLVEPCPSFSVCMSKVFRAEPRPFISSDTVLFRPIHPENMYKCVCPRGFAGLVHSNDCDTEVDLCYSTPCQNGGTCHPHEGECTCSCPPGFTGERCEVNMTKKYDAITCPHNICRPSSVCVPLIRGGFRCDGCPDNTNYDEYCRLKTRHFRKGSYLTFPSLKARNRFTIKLRFATQAKSGLLLYNGRFNGEHDFVGLEIINSQVTFTFSLGSNLTSVSTYIPGGVSTGQWFPVTVEYHQRVVTLTVGENCDTNIAIMYGDRLNNYSCAARVTHVLPTKCNKSTVNCHRLLDVTGPLQLGGLPFKGQVAQQDFVGCISDVEINGKLLDLNASVVNNETGIGCPQRNTHCQSAPCTMGGKCKEGWNTFTCECPEKNGGKDCSMAIEESRQLKGNGYLMFTSLPQHTARFSWYNGMSFRTRATSGTLMQITMSTGQARLKLVNGFIQYSYGNASLMLDSIMVNDGHWHYVEARWYLSGTGARGSLLELLLDYGQRQKSIQPPVTVSGSNIQSVYVGGYRQGNGPITDGFVGCVKDFRVGNNPNARLNMPLETSVTKGCSAPDSCSPSPCGPGTCMDVWGHHLCTCPPGTIGESCEDVCSFYNPCENWAECKRPAEGETTYSCECGTRQSGQYCQHAAPLECPAAWWGNPVCGPCNCDTRRGFDRSCDKKNGTCFCKELHYQPVGSNECFPCNCYLGGSEGPTCDPFTGRCRCKPGIMGRRCDQCDNKFAGISLIKDSSGKTKTTCRVTSYDNCPRNYAMGIWWDPVPFGETAVQDCPEGSSGTARRGCKQTTSWLPPDLFNCTSDNFTQLQKQLEMLQEVDKITPFSANLAIEFLKNATNSTRPLFGGDILMTIDFTKAVLKFEINPNQTGLSLISEQYGGFVQQLMIALSNVTSLPNRDFWPRINRLNQGAATLVRLLERYLGKIAKNMHQAQSAPFEAVSDGIVFGADWLTLTNGSMRSVPKYDNIINKGSANDYVSILLPKANIAGGSDKLYFGYAIYHTMGKLMEMNTDDSIVKSGLPLTVNGPIFSFVLANHSQVPSGRPVYIRLKLASPRNRTNLQCAMWIPGNSGPGVWSASECSVADTDCQVTAQSEECQVVYITCQCNHLSTYAIIVHEDGTVAKAAAIQLQVVMYVLVVVSLVLLVMAFFILISYKALQTNWNSIHTNLVFVIIICELAFTVGINRTSPELFCRLVAISLHYFYMSAFAWLFVEVLHIYRMLTEKQTINYGSMKFYYLLGYVIPGIIVGLAVGLFTEGYGNDSFCWLETSQMFIWSFAGPIVVVVVINIITFMLAVKASCREKVPVVDISSIRLGLLGAMTLLLLLSVTWVVGLLAVNFEDIPALAYVHTIFLFLQGNFLFVIFILLSKKVRLCLKRTWLKLQGKKLDIEENLTGTRSSVMSRSALAYRNDTASSTEGGLRINVGISTTSTTSQSSKSTGRYPPRFRDDFGRSTSSSTSGGHMPSGSSQPPNTGVAPYGYSPNVGDVLAEEPYEGPSPTKPEGNESDSDSDASMDRNSLDLASSHSSDEDDDFEIGPPWDQHIPKSKAVAQAREQLEKHKKDKERERLGNNNSDPVWVDSGQVDISIDNDPPPTSRPHISSVPPDVTLSAAAQRSGRKVTIVPPVRSDSLQNNYATSSSNVASEVAPATSRVQVQVLTHNGSLSSDSESSDETNV